MDTIHKLEEKVAVWYRNMPHLPENVREWLARNIWWIVLVGVILGGIGVFLLLIAAGFIGGALSLYGGAVGTAVGGLIAIVSFAIIAFMAITIVLSAMAVPHLQSQLKKGWTLLFIVVLVQVAQHVLSFVFSWNLLGLVWDLFFTALGAYFLFEIRGFFGAAAHGHKKPAEAVVSEPKIK